MPTGNVSLIIFFISLITCLRLRGDRSPSAPRANDKICFTIPAPLIAEDSMEVRSFWLCSSVKRRFKSSSERRIGPSTLFKSWEIPPARTPMLHAGAGHTIDCGRVGKVGFDEDGLAPLTRPLSDV